MAKFYLEPVASPASTVVSAAKEIVAQNNISLPKAISYIQTETAKVASNPNYKTDVPIAAITAQQAINSTSLTPASNQVNAVNSSPTPLVLAPSASTVSALQSAANQAGKEHRVVPVADTISAAAQAKAEQDAQTQREVAAVDAEQQRLDAIAQKAIDAVANKATSLGYKGDLTNTAAMQNFIYDSNKAVADAQAKAVIEKQLADKPYLLNLDTTGVQGDIPTAVWNASLSAKRQAESERQDAIAQAATTAVANKATSLGYKGDLTNTAAMQNFIYDSNKAVADAQANVANTKVTNDTLATLGGTETTKVADTGTVVDKTKLNTQGGESALATSPVTGLATSQISTLDTKPISTLDTKPISTLDTKPISTLDTKPISTLNTKPISTLDTKPISTLSTAGTQALTTADLATWGKTLPQGITADQLTAALKTQEDTLNKSYANALAGNQTALTSQNANFLKDWNTSADALKTNILSGVDTKNQAFGTQATQGFMDAFKNFQIPTNQQTGVNLGNYNDNRNAAADQWWSQYVTGRR